MPSCWYASAPSISSRVLSRNVTSNMRSVCARRPVVRKRGNPGDLLGITLWTLVAARPCGRADLRTDRPRRPRAADVHVPALLVDRVRGALRTVLVVPGRAAGDARLRRP